MDAITDLLPARDTPTSPEDKAVLEEKEHVPTRPLSEASMLAAIPAVSPQAAEPATPTRPVIRPSQLPKYLTNDSGEPVTVFDADGGEHVIQPGEIMRDALGRPQPIPDMAKYRAEKGIPAPLIRYRVTARKGDRVAQPVECDAVDESDAVRQTIKTLGIEHSIQWTWAVFVLAK